MALPEEIHVGKTYVSPRWKGARTVKRLERKNSLLSGTRKMVVHFVCQSSGRTGHAELPLFARNAQVQDLLSDQAQAPVKLRRTARLTQSQLHKLARKAGIQVVEGDEGAALLMQLAAFADQVAAHCSEKCMTIAREHQKAVGTYAAGQKAGALECAQALSRNAR